MRRRDFIKVIGGMASGWPFFACAQQSIQMKRIAILMSTAESNMESMVGASTFVRGLEDRGWRLGDNVQVEYRWAEANTNLYRRFARELVALDPDVILAVGGIGVSALQQVTHTIPIVFVATNDPIDRGLITSIDRPGGNTTGFINFESSMGRTWLELLKQVAPSVSRVGVIRNPTQFSGIGLAAIEKAAPLFSVDVSPIDARGGIEMEQSITTFARVAGGGLIVTPSPFSVFFRDQIIMLADRNKLPAVYFNRFFVDGGGLISYGPDVLEQYRGAAGYVDRILKGEKPAGMPIQPPEKFELVINLKVAKTLGLNMPAPLLARAKEVTE